MDKLEFEILRNKIEEHRERSSSQEGYMQKTWDHPSEESPEGGGEERGHDLPYFKDEEIEWFLAERSDRSSCCPRRMRKFLEEAWVSLPAKGAGREPGTEFAGGEESRTLPYFSEEDLGRFLDERAEGGCPELLQLFLSKEEEGARQEIREEGEEWTACMAGAIDDYLPEGMELSHSRLDTTVYGYGYATLRYGIFLVYGNDYGRLVF